MLKTKSLVSVIFVMLLVLMSIGFIYSADDNGSIRFDNQGGQIVVGPTGGICQEDWSGSTWSQCVDGQQTFICFDKNSCGTTSLKPAQCGATQSCDTTTTTQQTTTSSGGGGGGGSGGGGSVGGGGIVTSNTQNSNQEVVCVENWECGDWSNAENMCGKRTCIDKNSCGTTELKPVTADSCPNIFTSFFSFLTGGVIGGIGSSAKEGRGIILAVLLVLIAVGIGIVLFRRQSKINERIRKRGY